MCRLTTFEGRLQSFHDIEDDAVKWLEPQWITTPTKCNETRLPSTLKPTISKCVHLVTSGHFWSRNK